MKKIRALFFVVILLCVAWPVMVEAYIVEKGDTSWGIAKANKTTVGIIKRLNPRIEDVSRIKVGQKINLPDKDAKTRMGESGQKVVASPYWTNPNGDKYSGTIAVGLEILGYSSISVKKLEDEIASGNFIWAEIVHISRGGGLIDNSGNRYYIIKMLSGGGKGAVKVKEGPNGVIPNWSNSSNREAGRLYKSGTDYLFIPLVCNNLSLVIPVIESKDEAEAPKKEIEESEENFEEEPKEKAIREPTEEPISCNDQREFNSGIYARIGSIGSPGQALGFGGYGEALYPWRNFNDDCASEYWWAPGIFGGVDAYEASYDDGGGHSEKLAFQLGLKREWTGGKEVLFRQWTAKPRLGWAWSHWSNDDGYVNQSGAGAGLFGEYRHELVRDKLAFFARIDSWFGLGDQEVSSNFDNVDASSKTSGELLAGLDYKFTPSWTLRSFAGIGYEGWTDYFPAIIGSEMRHKIGNGWTVVAGIKGKFYAAINPAAMVSFKLENFKFIPKWYKNSRQEEIKPAGRGIGGGNAATIDAVY